MNIDELCVYNFMLKEGNRHSEYLAMLKEGNRHSEYLVMQSFLFMDSDTLYYHIITFIQETSKDINFNECQYIAYCF